MAATVLVTGGSGYIAANIIRQLLDEGWTVHTTIRDLAKEGDVRKRFPDHADRLTFFQAELLHDEGWAAAMTDCTHVAHVASPVVAATPKHENDLILPARDGTLRVLKFAKEAGVKRFVQTSSVAAVAYGVDAGTHEFDESNWTDVNHPDSYAYVKSKTYAEKAARDWIRDHGEGMEYCSINPGLVLGPIDGGDFSASVLAMQQLLDGSMPMAPNIAYPLVDVRDVADLHVKALSADKLANDRFLAAGPTLTFQEMGVMLHEKMGEKAKKVPTKQMPNWLVSVLALFNAEVRGIKSELGKVRKITGTHSQDKLGWQMRPPEETLEDCANSLIEHGVVTV